MNLERFHPHFFGFVLFFFSNIDFPFFYFIFFCMCSLPARNERKTFAGIERVAAVCVRSRKQSESVVDL